MSIQAWWKSKNKVEPEPVTPVERLTDYRVVAATLSDVGLVRTNNEDSTTFAIPELGDVRSSRGALAIVADGMGGHNAGEVASRLAVDNVLRLYYLEDMTPSVAIRDALIRTNTAIQEHAVTDPALRKMGTTCTALALVDGQALIAHAGDSRVYLVRDDGITLLSEDHSVVMEMVRKGLLSVEEARKHPNRNVLMNVLGTRPECEVFSLNPPLDLKMNDRFLLCSDGLFDLVEDAEILEALRNNAPQTACNSLIILAKSRGGFDNITATVFYVQPLSSAPRPQAETSEVEAIR